MITRKEKRGKSKENYGKIFFNIYVHSLRQHITTHTRLHSEDRLAHKDTHKEETFPSSGLNVLVQVDRCPCSS